MAVLKWWHVMLFLCITQFLYGSYCDDEEEIDNCIADVLRLQAMVTGYDHHEYDRQSLEKKSLDDLQQIIAHLYDELECGYFFSAQLHLNLTGSAVFYTGDTGVLTSKTVGDFSFYEEATMMIDSLLDPKDGRVNDLWILFVYARQIRVFFAQYVNGGGGALNYKIINENQHMHDYVLSVIDGRVAEGCAFENYFNMKFEKHLSIADERPSFVRTKETARVIDTIRRNKHLLNENFKSNWANQSLQFSRSESFAYGLLLFRDEQTFKLFLDEFLAAKSERIDVRFPDFAAGLTIKSFGEYLHRIIDMLKIIMLQITLSYVSRLAEIADSGDVLVHAQNFDDEVLVMFIVLMVLNDDTEFKSIYENYVYCYITLLTYAKVFDEQRFRQCKSELNKSIDYLTWDIRRDYNLPTKIISAVTDSDKSLSDILEVGKRFVDKIKNDIGEHSIRLVQSFLKMINEKYTSVLPRR
ncbi:uncharacterized protein LOC126842098 [Adelges cooleyi]|uniref:uncharacterized protein LOC126842098 n=1 Tax=Adelges cooleyi TaxID=133065 RepID=UPI00217FA417|nr:uncharacterized protein LOC126842098 [Adelges cooleyi]